MAVTIFEDLVLRERGDSLLEVAGPQRQQRALVVEERHARGQCRHLRLRKVTTHGQIHLLNRYFFRQNSARNSQIFCLGEIQLRTPADRIIQLRFLARAELGCRKMLGRCGILHART